MYISKPKLIITLTAVFVFGTVLSGIGFYALGNSGASSPADSDKLSEIQKYIDSYYLEDYDEEELAEGIYKGYVQGLGDPYSAYMDSEEYDSWKASATGDYSGIGITFSEDERGMYVILSVSPDSPAEKAGIKEGDFIITVDGEEYQDSDVMAAAIRGKAGTEVTVEIARDGEKKEFRITREKIETKSVEGKMLDSVTGYISISSFVSSTGEDFGKELDRIENKGADSLILDLRDNGGGLVDQCVEVADRFLDEGVVCYVQDRNGNSESYDAKDGKTKLRTIVLVNENSASASEILAAALQDNGYQVLGNRTFGKGVIQTTLEMSDGSALKLTVMEYLSPDKHKVNKVGVKPDISVDDKESTEADEQLEKAKAILN
ncbi:MAG: S41 family peptidase [Lentihominibacter sp.]